MLFAYKGPGFLNARPFCLLAVLAVLGCRHAVNVGPPVEPLAAPGEIEPRLRRLENFAFSLEYGTDRPFALGARFTGVRDSSDRESWRGVWWRGAERRDFAVVGDGPVQYERSGAEWTREPRGNESKIFDHLEQVLRLRLEFIGETGRRYRYRFEPRMPVLDPSGGKELIGELEIERRTGLLRQVSCREEGGPAHWQLSLSRFNRAGRVRVPFLAAQEIVLVPFRPQGRKELGLSTRAVETRLERLDRRYRLFRKGGELLLQLEQEEPAPVLGLLLGPGETELWAAEETELADTVAGVLEVGGDAARRVRLVERLGGNGDFTAEVALEFIARPMLAFSGTGARPLPDSGLVALLLNGRVLDAARSSRGRVEFGNAGTRELVPVLAVVAGLPAAAGLRAAESRKLP